MKNIVLFVFLIIFLFSCATHQNDVKYASSTKQVSPTLQNKLERFLKRKVAIGRFSNETKYGKSFFSEEKDKSIEKQASDILSSKLTASEKFILLERTDIDLVNKEMNVNSLSAYNIPADYLIIGSVSEFGRKATGDVGIFDRTKKQTAFATVNIRLVNVKTGQITYSEEATGEASSETKTVMGVGGRAGYDSSLNDKAISAAISKLVNNIIEKLMDNPWKAYILDMQEGSYLISGGKSQGIQAGDIFGVYKKGKVVVNPQTKIPIELPGKFIGKVKVISLLGDTPENEVSLCGKVSGELPLADFAGYYIKEEK